ncbi:MAG: Na+/H+ antiporter subunit E, partial [Phycisphaeraceae bacterium]|nr:Na+/H+ antiporter subunit E [Phycisphaeraceae bacterium]
RGRHHYGRKLLGLVRFFFYFVRILVVANLQVAREVLTPGFQMNPRIIAYPVDDLTDVQITTLASAITLTPGTLSVDVSDDGRVLYVHAMYARDRAAAFREIDQLRNRLMREVFGS